jgi:hypothetical protein
MTLPPPPPRELLPFPRYDVKPPENLLTDARRKENIESVVPFKNEEAFMAVAGIETLSCIKIDDDTDDDAFVCPFVEKFTRVK